MKVAVMVILIVMLCACGTIPPSEKKVLSNKADKWVGRTVDELIVANGEPASVHPLESGGRIFEYFEDKVDNQNWSRTHIKKYSHKRRFEGELSDITKPLYRTDKPFVAPTPVAPPASLTPAKSTRTASDPTQSCRILFTISASDIIEEWSAEGEGCN